ncbi:ribosomal RNA small subunit methyltransferase B [Serratia symbiotica str. 'Cinara cedri']|nr:ribosomal RNA small subunit methyltransferase B [Serratia symbiotica str. 'Cinara cedri']
MKNNYNIRSHAAKIIGQVLDQGRSLNSILPTIKNNINNKDSALLQEICFGTLRMLPQLKWFIQQLMTRPMIGKHSLIHYLLLIGLYQLLYTRIPPYAVLAETVNGAVELKYPQLKGLINGILRQFLRQQSTLVQSASNNQCRYLHPSWLLKRIQLAYPMQWEQIINANNQKPPMWLRINRLHHTRVQYLQLINKLGIAAKPHTTYTDALRLLTPCDVNNLPGFTDGWITIQDASAQGCISLLNPQNNEQILDLCAAPGGKTTHILEAAPKAKVMAIDINQQRITRIKENLQRLHLHAEIKLGDGRTPQQWCGNKQFDRILLDAPCSASGVIRRHPDIKWLRRDCDIAKFTSLQAEILTAIWPHLKSSGVMIYATCSILPEENSEQIAAFLKNHKNARLVETGSLELPGQQNLPHPEDGDGFFCAKLIKI